MAAPGRPRAQAWFCATDHPHRLCCCFSGLVAAGDVPPLAPVPGCGVLVLGALLLTRDGRWLQLGSEPRCTADAAGGGALGRGKPASTSSGFKASGSLAWVVVSTWRLALPLLTPAVAFRPGQWQLSTALEPGGKHLASKHCLAIAGSTCWSAVCWVRSHGQPMRRCASRPSSM